LRWRRDRLGRGLLSVIINPNIGQTANRDNSDNGEGDDQHKSFGSCSARRHCTAPVLEKHLTPTLLVFRLERRLVRKGYRNLSVPDPLVDELERFVTESRGRYVSVAEVVREAVREFLERRRTKRQ